jgi:phosphoserine phosphatase
VQLLKEWLVNSNETLENSCFYSDSHNDLPLLKLVERPIAVNPDDKLRQVAQDSDWSIISLRD